MTWAGLLRWGIVVPFLVIVVTVIAGVTWWVTADLSPPLTETGDPVLRRADGSIGEYWRAGETIYLDLKICVSRPLPGVFHRSYLNASVQKLQEVEAPTQVTGCRIEQVPTEIPRGFTPGPYVLRSEITHRVRWQDITYRLRDLPVVVSANPLTDSVDARYLALVQRIMRIEQYLKLPPIPVTTGKK